MGKNTSSASVASPLLTTQAWSAISRRLKLSPREVQIIQLVFHDQKEKKIAEKLGMSPHTVRSHMDRMHRKLGVKSRVELVLRIAGCFLALTAEDDSPLPPICGKAKPKDCPLFG
jgi:DNA-binding CsgD family transcriptional regulator